MNKYKLNAINYLRAEIKTARKAREENNISTLHGSDLIGKCFRAELDYCSTIGIFSLENKKMLIKIAERMIYNNDSR